MLVLDTTTKSLKINLTQATTASGLDFTAAYIDSANSITEGASDGTINGTTDVTLVAAPQNGTKRVVKYITVYNGDTAAATFNLKYDNNGTQRQIVKITLQPGSTWFGDV
jgi:hypothetical protein